MFTGIVEEVGTVKAARPGLLVIAAKKVLEGTRSGDSVNVQGACLTVAAMDGATFTVEVMPETLRRTNLGRLRAGDRVNLERALTLGGRIGGHLVQGHIDDTGRVLALRPEAKAVIARFQLPRELSPYVVEKGFIGVDGVSLTVVEKREDWFSVSLVSFTRENTTLGKIKAGDIVNLEVDIIAKYVASLTGKGFLSP